MITLTENALNEINRLKTNQHLEEHYLRVGVQGGGCSGLMYNMRFDKEVGPYDKVFDVDGVKIIVDIKSALYLKGTTLDFSSDLTGGGFKFVNPSANRSCGCGASFSA
jgi:iron-sulfur cluster assembly protein